jgi:hypothetical protein
VCNSNDVGSRVEGVKLDFEKVILLVEVFFDFSQYVKENILLPILGTGRFLPYPSQSIIFQ